MKPLPVRVTIAASVIAASIAVSASLAVTTASATPISAPGPVVPGFGTTWNLYDPADPGKQVKQAALLATATALTVPILRQLAKNQPSLDTSRLAPWLGLRATLRGAPIAMANGTGYRAMTWFLTLKGHADTGGSSLSTITVVMNNRGKEIGHDIDLVQISTAPDRLDTVLTASEYEYLANAHSLTPHSYSAPVCSPLMSLPSPACPPVAVPEGESGTSPDDAVAEALKSVAQQVAFAAESSVPIDQSRLLVATAFAAALTTDPAPVGAMAYAAQTHGR